MDEAWRKYFDPQVLESLRGFRLRGKRAAEGMLAGAHRSPRTGQAVEFAEHRQYAPGDDLRQLDWKVLGRTDKYYLRQREDETTLDCHLMVDCSGSMAYRGSESQQSKWECALRVAAALAFVAIENNDTVSWTTIGHVAATRLPTGGGNGQLLALAAAMDRADLDSGDLEQSGDIPKQWTTAVQGLRKGGLIILISDLMDEAESLVKTIRAIRYSGRPLIVIQVVDPDEEDFPFQGTVQYDGLEGESAVTADTQGIASAYREEFKRHRQSIEQGCRSCESLLWLMRSDQPLAALLPEFLSAL